MAIDMQSIQLKTPGAASLCRAQETPSVRDRRACRKKVVRTALVRNQKWNELNYCSFKKESFLCILVSFGVSIILIVIYLMKPIINIQ